MLLPGHQHQCNGNWTEINTVCIEHMNSCPQVPCPAGLIKIHSVRGTNIHLSQKQGKKTVETVETIF